MEELQEMTYSQEFSDALQSSGISSAGQLEKFALSEVPGNKDEEYKYTNVQKFINAHIDGDKLGSSNAGITEDFIKENLIDEEGSHLVFINGIYQKQHSQVSDSAISLTQNPQVPFQHTKLPAEIWTSLNEGIGNDFVKITIAKNKEAKPLFVYQFLSSDNDTVITPSLFVEAEQSASINILEKTILAPGSGSILNSKVFGFDVDANASINFSAVQNYSDRLIEVNNLFANQQKDSRFYSNLFTFRGKMIRNNIYLDLLEENCESHMHGIYLINGKSHVDNHTTVDHRVPNCMSNELYKGIVDEKATGVFNGKIYVRPNAQQTNAYQTNNNISLSDQATIHTKPQLEIWADDVKCSHGCTIGQLDEDAIFYLRARGIDETRAKAMMLVAFSEEAFEFVPFDFLKEELHSMIEARLIG